MHDTPAQKTRLEWIDILKFLGILAIVWGHTLSDGLVHHYLYSFHVPLFFFATGLYFTPPKDSFGRFTCKKIFSILVPYALFAIISILLFSVLGRFATSSLETDVSGSSLPVAFFEMLMGICRSNRPLWFLPCLFVFYLLCFWIFRFTAKQTIRMQRMTMFFVIVISVSLCFFNENVFQINRLFWKADVALFMLAFFAFAFLVKPLFGTQIKTGISLLVALFLLFLGGTAAFLNTNIIYLGNHYGNVLFFYMSAFCTIMGLCFISIAVARCKCSFVSKVGVYVGQRTLPILLMHKFPILFFQVIFPWTRQPLRENDAFVGLLVAIISIVACLVVDIFLRRFFPVFVGQKRKKNLPEQARQRAHQREF